MSYSRGQGSAAASRRKATSDSNQRILSTLLQDPGNRYCADCKVAGHPRWASWSLGIFICIRCSGIHRSLGTHISKVRSVDLDTWSDEHLEPMIKWGNKRANLYWEHKLPDDYVPDDAKIASFIRTKYDLKRWAMSSTVPDPSQLTGQTTAAASSDTSKPAATKAAVSSTTGPTAYHHSSSRGPSLNAPPPKKATGLETSYNATSLIPDLLGDDIVTTAAPTTAVTSTSSNGANTVNDVFKLSKQQYTAPPASKPSLNGTGAPATKSDTAAPRNTTQKDSLLFGLDLSSPPTVGTNWSTPSPTVSGPDASSQSATSRPDLKKSILSLYSSSNSSNFNPPRPTAVASPGFDLSSATSSLSLGGSQQMSLGGQVGGGFGQFTNAPTSSSSFSSDKAKTTSAFSDISTSLAWDDSTASAKTSSTAFSAAPITSTGSDDWIFSSTPSAQPPAQAKSTQVVLPEDDSFANVWS